MGFPRNIRISGLTDSQLRSLAGNSIAVPCIGVIMMTVLSCINIGKKDSHSATYWNKLAPAGRINKIGAHKLVGTSFGGIPGMSSKAKKVQKPILKKLAGLRKKPAGQRR